MKTYRGYVENDRPHVTVRETKSPSVVVHHKKHSDAPLNWGVDAEAGRDLARSILLDAFGVTSCNDIECFCESKWVESVYDKFYEEVVGKFKAGEEWRITQYEVCDFSFNNSPRVLEEVSS